ncbi:MAG: hypothetical protein JWP16_1287 [Alphaproteobacteria bacterium]|jgi:hypothetical protein|nr:hypothetical protein [Alphaproteobacteria bacterium]
MINAGPTTETRNLRRLAEQMRGNASETQFLHYKKQMQKLAEDLDAQATKIEDSFH